MTINKENLIYIQALQPSLYRQIQTTPFPDTATLSKTKNGMLTADIDNYTLHSTYNPIAEAQKRIAAAFSPDITIAIVFNPGLGYCVDALINQNPALLVMCIEPDIKRLAFGLSARRWDSLQANHQIFFFYQDTIDSIPVFIEYQNEIHAFKYMHHGFFTGSGITDKQLQYNETIKKTLCEPAFRDVRSNALTVDTFAGLWTRNTILNLTQSHNSLNELLRCAWNVPACLIGAGPALNHTLPALRNAQHKMLLVTVDTALPALHAAGIIPHIIVSVDAQLANYRDFYFCRSRGSRLVVDITAHPFIARYSGMPSYFFYTTRLYTTPSDTVKELPLPSSTPARTVHTHLGSLQSGGTVASSALDLLIQLNIKKIFLIGNDLSYPHLQTHAINTAADILYRTTACRFAPYTTLPYRALRPRFIRSGKQHIADSVPTDYIFLKYARWFKHALATADIEPYSVACPSSEIMGINAISISSFEHILSNLHDTDIFSLFPAVTKRPAIIKQATHFLQQLQTKYTRLETSLTTPEKVLPLIQNDHPALAYELSPLLSSLHYDLQNPQRRARIIQRLQSSVKLYKQASFIAERILDFED